MKKLLFPKESYEYNANKESYIFKGEDGSIIGKLELLWGMIQSSTVRDLKISEHKTNKKLKKAIKVITEFKDKDEDSRISLPNSQELILEDAEFELLKRHVFDGNSIGSRGSEDYIDLIDIIESAKDYTIPTK